MAFVIKSVKFVYGLFLLLLFTRKINLNRLFRGRRIAIVGAAKSAIGTGKGDYIDGFDFVIRINKAPFVLREGKFRNDIGAKSHILFHSFFENEEFGGGALDFQLYDSLGIRYVINPIPTFFGFRNTLNFYKKYLQGRHVFTLPRKGYKNLEAGIENFRPTIGMCALKATLETDFSELFITGFTFFKTSYSDGYRNSLQAVDELRNTMDRMKIHNPDKEFKEFLKLLKENGNKKIVMDPTLKSIIEMEEGK